MAKNLEEILELDINKIIPGHGPIMTKEAINPMINYFDQLISEVENFMRLINL